MQYAVLSTSAAYFAFSAMALSLLLNITNLAILHIENYSPDNHPSSLPLKLREVAHSVASPPEGRYGLNNAKDRRSLIPHHGQYFNWMLDGIEITTHAAEHSNHCGHQEMCVARLRACVRLSAAQVHASKYVQHLRAFA
ncbi:hypothetical protein CVT25_003758 [Psilocybe cyanescens]|uniref:Uncharacterized protein n=1 Tax=Psilocybe cyanescens TaxID=93625 RepID=A0A409XTP0_PSICY|nr:hypothetical protein CVT25_003758 [Psilocybe cyanescens]